VKKHSKKDKSVFLLQKHLTQWPHKIEHR